MDIKSTWIHTHELGHLMLDETQVVKHLALGMPYHMAYSGRVIVAGVETAVLALLPLVEVEHVLRVGKVRALWDADGQTAGICNSRTVVEAASESRSKRLAEEAHLD
jgi:hypothetical protein